MPSAVPIGITNRERIERTMPATLELLETFARAGGTVIAVGTTPSLAPGFVATAADRENIEATAHRLFGAGAPGKSATQR